MNKKAHWVWDPDAIDWFIGGWKCSNCHCVNHNLGSNSKENPMFYVGAKYCPECGKKMFYINKNF